jgi:adenine-specific DNA-methyltransferase
VRGNIEIQRWDQASSVIQRFDQKSIYDNLEKFYEYLENASPKQELSVIAHTTRIYRELRAVLGDRYDGFSSLEGFLYLLACTKDKIERNKLEVDKWAISQDAAQMALDVPEDKWNALQNELMLGRPIENISLDIDLLLQHASGQLFQEAHYAALYDTQSQMVLNGFLPSPVRVGKEVIGRGVHFTPSWLARTLVEESLNALNPLPSNITVFDPACGSGEFLRETLRQLLLKGYNGKVRIIGWDISKAACDMAKFALSWEIRWLKKEKISVDIRYLDSLEPENVWPSNVDIILMNPPFVSWPDLDEKKKKYLFDILGNQVIKMRPDYSYAFIWKAVTCLREKGILGTLFPASFFDGTSAKTLRGLVSEQMYPKLLARLGSHMLFPGALVDAAFYVAQKNVISDNPAVIFWSDHRSISSSAGLRALRKIRLTNSNNIYPVEGEGFSIYLSKALGHGENNWSPRRYRSWKLLEHLSNLPKVKDLFDVRQGAITGRNMVFVLSRAKWSNLPDKEKPYFRPAVLNNSIQQGFLQENMFVFFPYGKYAIKNENELKNNLKNYYEEYLEPNKLKLTLRIGINNEKWWELSRNVEWQMEKRIKIVSKYFGDLGSFALDKNGGFIVVQGYGWIPKHEFPKSIYLAYLAILNSRILSELLAATSNNMRGGQWNLSKRFVDQIAIPDLLGNQIDPSLIFQISKFGKCINEGEPIDYLSLNALVIKLYGADWND